jgi:hypothetical protein
MDKSDFTIGREFTTETGRWRCTDIGTRVICAIKVDLPFEVVELDDGNLRKVMVTNPSWFNGPPYAVAEHVFDEDAMQDCSPIGA